MAWVILALTSESWEPLAGVVVEAYSLDDPNTILTRATTDISGIAKFLTLTTGRYFFKPRITRGSGAFGEKGQMTGMVRLQILNSSGATCVDAWVDPTGAHGTDATIQAAITRLASETGTVNIFIAEGTYAENLTISSTTASYNLVGCGERLSGWPILGTFSDTPLTVKVNGAAGIALRITSNTSVVCTGIEFYNNNTGPVVASDHASCDLRLTECHVHNDSTGDAIGSTTGPIQLHVDHCILKGTHAIAVPTATQTLWAGHSWLLGKTNGQSTVGLAEIINCYVSASNSSASIDLYYALARILGCTIAQNGTGDGIDVQTAGVMQIANCDISGVAGSSTNGIAANAGAFVNCANNEIFGFTNGVNVNATASCQMRGHIYKNVTNWVIGVPYFIGAQAYRNANQTIATATITKVQLNTENFDPNNNFDNATNYEYVAPMAGYYQVNGEVLWAVPAATANIASILVYVNGGLRLRGQAETLSTTAGQVKSIVVSGIIRVSEGDTVDLRVYQDSGGNVDIVNFDAGTNRFDIHLLQQ